MTLFSRREFLGALPSLAALPLFGCDRSQSGNLTGGDEQDKIPNADLYIGFDPDEDAQALADKKIQNYLRSLRPSQSFTVAFQGEGGSWHTILYANAPAGTGGVEKNHLAMVVDGAREIHVAIIGSVPSLIPMPRKLALQFTDQHGNPFQYNGLPMRYSLFTEELNVVRGKPAMVKALSDILGSIVKIFAFAIGVFIGASIAKWVFAVLAYLASQILMFIAATAFIIVVVEVLRWLDMDITREDVEAFFSRSAQSVKDLFGDTVYWLKQFGDSNQFPADVVWT